MAFDPDEYLRTPQQKQSGFDADQFLGSPQQESVFDVDAYLKQPQATTEQPSPQRKTLKERGTEVGTAGGLSAALGFVSPELFTLAGGLAATTPLTAPAAPFLFTTGQALRGQRLAQAGYGLLGGLVGESGGQVVEASGGTPFQAEVARFLGGTFGPEGVRQLGKAGGTVVARSLQAMGVPGASKISTIGQMLELDNKRPGTLTAEQRAFIDKKLNEIRGGKPSLQAQQEVADMLARTAQQRVSQAEQQATALERQADELLTAAQTRAGQIDANTQQRIGALQSQFENAAIGLRQDADTRARQAIEAGRQRANQIMQQVQGQSPQLQSVARIDADQAIAQAQQQADQIAAQAQQKMASLRAKRQRLVQTSQRNLQQAQFRVGEPKRISDIGTDIREGFTSVLDGLRKTRSDNAKTYSQEAFGEAFQKEAAGASFAQTKSAQNAVQELNTMLQNPVSELSGVPEGTIRNQIEGVRDVLQGFRRTRKQNAFGKAVDVDVALKPSFDQLEVIRRNLRDRASGLPAEGYDAIGQQMAGRLADLVENTQKEFAPKFAAFLEKYKADSQPVNRFKNSLAKRITGREEADFAQFQFDPASLADNVFASRQGVTQLIETAPEQAENIARSYVANTLQNADAPAVQRFLSDRKTQDWLDLFPRLQQELMAGAQRLGIVERRSSARGQLAKALGTEIEALPGVTATATRRAEELGTRTAKRLEREGETKVRDLTSAGERQSQQAITAGEQQFRDITGGAEQQLGASAKAVERQQRALREQAERAGKAEVGAAEKAATGLTKEAAALRKSAEENAKLLTRGYGSDPERIADLIVSRDINELLETAEVILSNPAGKERFADAVSQVVADLADKSSKTVVQKWKYVGPRLVKAGLIDERLSQQLADQLQELLVTPVSAQEKLTLVKSLFKNAIVSYAGPGIVRGGQALLEDEDAVR
jgi:hypothetical protein